jgi:hypothetical protein
MEDDDDSLPDLIPLMDSFHDVGEFIPPIMWENEYMNEFPVPFIFQDFFQEWFPQIRTIPTHETIIHRIVTQERIVKEPCPICYGRRFHTMERTNCGHLFCPSCSETYFAKNKSCPMCRSMVCTLNICIATIPVHPPVRHSLLFSKKCFQ